MIKKALKLLDFSPEERETNEMVLDLVEDLCIREIDPHDSDMEEQGVNFADGKVALPPPMGEIRKKMAENDLFGLFTPEEYEGMGLSYTLHTAVIERLAHSNAAVSLFLPVHGSAMDTILRHGTEEAKEYYLPKLATGKFLGALTFTEPNSGSDLGSVSCAAPPSGDSWIINGTKIFVTHAGVADVYVGLFSTDREKRSRGLSAFIIDAHRPGLNAGRIEKKLGLHDSSTGDLVFHNYEVPPENLLGKENHGYSTSLDCLTGSRIGIAAQSVGIAVAAQTKALEYSKQRKQFKRPISEFQAIQTMLANMEMKIEGARALYLGAAHHKSRGRPYATEASAAKLYASEIAQEVCADAIQIHGGYGYIEEYGVARHYRDARVMTIYEGTSEVQRLIIAKNLLSGRKV
ncbi:MAG: acyl-CoA dehydrogenase family protein [Candidatus Heimdallarchaeota archaeon]